MNKIPLTDTATLRGSVLAAEENRLTGTYPAIPTPAACPRCGGTEFVVRTPFPSELVAKRMCRGCYWIADARPDELQPGTKE